MQTIYYKIKRKLWEKWVSFSRHRVWYPYIYKSSWYRKTNSNKGINGIVQQYFSAIPNSNAGIGHQMANWIAGYWFAQQFNLKFAHIPFSSNKWDSFLGFGYGEIPVQELIKQGYKKVRLPLFDENNVKEVTLIKTIISAYSNKKVIFVCEQDQFYQDQFGVMYGIQQKFYSAPQRKVEKLIYSDQNYNIAIHVRRGDILADPNNPNLKMRFMANDYFETVLKQVIAKSKTEKLIHIYFFSQGRPEDYPEFHSIQNLHWCLDMDPQASFLHMVFADVLITSKSSFSYKPALLNKNIKVVPNNFWHGYPQTQDWVLVDDDGQLDFEERIKM
ncbi:hypothetical protein MPF19_14120 [Polaribacter sp. Z014]|uniref:hypothetical protein n=1 Tax=Polaribacter sp. Z014 TaxID=2927126 RepID=UPI0020206289|nr:hypothetical protein [Polaribacter sp. Z014]MCL7764555.1 hypothetical protein [Polaribacter sp. Z014]